jgi:hypothetical protein
VYVRERHDAGRLIGDVDALYRELMPARPGVV